MSDIPMSSCRLAVEWWVDAADCKAGVLMTSGGPRRDGAMWCEYLARTTAPVTGKRTYKRCQEQSLRKYTTGDD